MATPDRAGKSRGGKDTKLAEYKYGGGGRLCAMTDDKNTTRSLGEASGSDDESPEETVSSPARQAAREMKDQLKGEISKMSSGDYLAAKRFLSSLQRDASR